MNSRIFNPYLPACEYIADGEAHVFGDRVYVYGSHDKFNATRYCADDYVAYSAPVTDLTSWRYEGVIYRRKGVLNRIGFKCMWAPDVCKGYDGRYYLYFCFGWKNYICVAVCDEPAGRYKFLGLVRHKDGTVYGKKKGDIMCFDPGVLCDDDGVYLYSGYSANEDLRRMLRFKGIRNVDGTGGQVIKLGKDMLTAEEPPKMLVPGYKNSAGTGFEGHEMYEASSVRKVNGKYYFVYSSRLSHELCYATSDYPDRDFSFGGAIVSNGDIGYNGTSEKDARNYWGNNHGCIEQINGKWYVFYHRQTNKTEQSRQDCAEQIELDADGKIKQVEITSQGLNGKPLDGAGYYPAYIACNLKSAEGAVKCAYGPFSKHKYKKHPCFTQEKDGDWKYQYIKNIRDGAEIGFKYFSLDTPLNIKVKTRGASGTLTVYDNADGKPVGEIHITKSKTWTESAVDMDITPGVKPLFFKFSGKGAIDFLGMTLK